MKAKGKERDEREQGDSQRVSYRTEVATAQKVALLKFVQIFLLPLSGERAGEPALALDSGDYIMNRARPSRVFGSIFFFPATVPFSEVKGAGPGGHNKHLDAGVLLLFSLVRQSQRRCAT